MVYKRKSAGICICCHPTGRGFSHCLIVVGRQRRSPRLYMQSMHSAIFLSKYRAENKIITYSRASTVAQSLTTIWNFARISTSQEFARINAFLSISLYQLRLTSNRGFCNVVSDRKDSNNSWDLALMVYKNILYVRPASVKLFKSWKDSFLWIRIINILSWGEFNRLL